MNAIVFGAGDWGKKFILDNTNNMHIIAFADNDIMKHGRSYMGHIVISPDHIHSYEYDKIIIAIDDYPDSSKESARVESAKTVDAIINQLENLGVSRSKIALAPQPYDARVDFLYKFSQIAHEDSFYKEYVAECGVYRGHFAAHINAAFPESTLFLFDTFEGFDERDIKCENPADIEYVKKARVNLINTSADIALLRCPFPENVVIKAGYVPDTFSGLEGKEFTFVNLDMDLYRPTLEALRFFVPRMVYGGVILIHDYYHKYFSGVKQAVKEYKNENSFTYYSIGDGSSIAVTPYQTTRR